MYPKTDKNDAYNLLKGMYKLTEEYKAVLNSAEYKQGRNMNRYLSMLKKGKILTIIKNLIHRNKDLDYLLPSAANHHPTPDDYMTNHKIAVYTSIFGPYDNLKEPIIKPNNIDYFIITDQEISDDSLWKSIDYDEVMPKSIRSSKERNRYVKMLPHKIFTDYEYSIYVDGNVFITSDLSVLTKTLKEYPIAMHRHKNRDCVYEEIMACIEKRKDDIKLLKKHEKLLREHELPSHWGLLEATVIARNHTDIRCIQIMENWWYEYERFSKRDQISLIDCIWTSGVTVDTIAKLGDNIMDNHNFVIIPHL